MAGPHMIRVCDYIAQRLHQLGIRHVYGIMGGGASGLNDGFIKHGGIRWIGGHHEQASAFAAVAQAKLTGKLAVVNPTTGCGSTNCITGVLDAWQDSVPVLFISGNVNRIQMTTYMNWPQSTNSVIGRRVRKQGVQEADIIELVSPITKFAQTIDTPEQIVIKLEAAIWFATHGRKGPVWLDVPTDIQTALIEPPAELPTIHWGDDIEIAGFVQALQAKDEVVLAWATSRRPLVLLGAGARDSRDEIDRLLRAANIPFVCTYGAIDFYPTDHPLYVGRVGIKGDRAGNFALAHCDLLLVLGSSLSTPVTGYDQTQFAPLAKIIVVDVDDHSNSAFDRHDLYVRSDVQTFVVTMLGHDYAPRDSRWRDKCVEWREKWPVCLPAYAAETAGINLYSFIDELSKALPDDGVVVSDAGSAIYVPCQGLKLRGNQRHIISLAQADMGWALPASIGVALEGRPTVVVTGDGSFQTNLQELATIRALNLPVKIFVWNNRGYLSIRATQRKLYEGRLMGTDESNGLWFPDLGQVALTYEMDYLKLDSGHELADALEDILSSSRAIIIEVICPADQPIWPTIGASRGADGTIKARPLYDMAPYLLPEEIDAERVAALFI